MTTPLLLCSPSDPLVKRPDPEGEWELCETVLVRDGEREFVIPKGFRSDLASIPRVVRPLMETSDLGILPPLAHDLLYRRGGLGLYTRVEADDLFHRLMIAESVSRSRRVAAYWAVRLFGRSAWRGQSSGEATERAST